MKRSKKQVLKTSGNTPEDREELTRAVREGRRVSRHSTSRGVGIGSSWQVLRADLRMRFLMKDSETGLKVQSGTPSNGFVRGRELVHTGWESRSSLSLMILSQKKVESSPGRSGNGNKVGRVDFVLASRLFVMLYSSLVENAEGIVLCVQIFFCKK